MQSRLAATWLIQRQQMNWVAVGHRWLATFPTGRAADPAVHSGDPEGEDADQAAMGAGATKPAPTTIKDPMAAAKRPQSSTPKLENGALNMPSDAHQKVQKRGARVEEVISCVGVDGYGIRDAGGAAAAGGQLGEETDEEYFSHHKPSALSEIEVADTRKPITKATDAEEDDKGGGRGDVVGWLPEQMDSAEEAMARASEIWWRNKIRGDPDSPQSRVLRELRGES